MESRTTRIPINLSGKKIPPASQFKSETPKMTEETPKRRIVLNKKIIPKITIKVDELIRDTFTNLASGKLRNVIDSDAVLDNSALIQYIFAIYDVYNIEDPLLKYGRHHGLSLQSKDMLDRRQRELSLRSHQQQFPLSKTAQLSNKLGSQHGTPMKPGSSNLQGSTVERTGDRSSSKKKIQRLKDSIKEGSNHQPVEIRTISLSTNKRSSSNIRKQIMFGSPEDNLKQRQQQTQENSKLLGTMQDYTVHQADTQYIQQQSQSQDRGRLQTSLLFRGHGGEIQPVFRYCFMCQCPILQANILHHQKKCPRFMELYNMDPTSIVNILVEKIQRLKAQIKEHTGECRQNQLGEAEYDLKKSVLNWMDNVEEAQRNNLQFSTDYQRAYDKILRVFDKRCFKLLELSYKLKWFLRIREKIKLSFKI